MKEREQRHRVPSALFPYPSQSYARTRITTRRFWARPSRVLFGLTGLSSPQLMTFILCSGYLMGLIEVTLDGFCAGFTDALVHHLVAARIGVTLDLDEVAARFGLELRNHLVDALLNGLGQLPPIRT